MGSLTKEAFPALVRKCLRDHCGQYPGLGRKSGQGPAHPHGFCQFPDLAGHGFRVVQIVAAMLDLLTRVDEALKANSVLERLVECDDKCVEIPPGRADDAIEAFEGLLTLADNTVGIWTTTGFDPNKWDAVKAKPSKIGPRLEDLAKHLKAAKADADKMKGQKSSSLQQKLQTLRETRTKLDDLVRAARLLATSAAMVADEARSNRFFQRGGPRWGALNAEKNLTTSLREVAEESTLHGGRIVVSGQR